MSEHRLEFQAPAGERLHKRFFGIQNDADLWWVDEQRRWVPWVEATGKCYGNTAPCNSVKAFKRHLRQHPELAGVVVTLVSRFVGYNVVARP